MNELNSNMHIARDYSSTIKSATQDLGVGNVNNLSQTNIVGATSGYSNSVDIKTAISHCKSILESSSSKVMAIASSYEELDKSLKRSLK